MTRRSLTAAGVLTLASVLGWSTYLYAHWRRLATWPIPVQTLPLRQPGHALLLARDECDCCEQCAADGAQ